MHIMKEYGIDIKYTNAKNIWYTRRSSQIKNELELSKQFN